MRNSTKKITAIAAALLLSVSTVATTAAMAAPSVFAANAVTPETVTDSTFEYGEDSIAHINVEQSSGDIVLYESADVDSAISNPFPSTAYAFGDAITPLDTSKTYYIRLFVDDDANSGTEDDGVVANGDAYKFVAVTLSYKNNVNVGTATVVATIKTPSEVYTLGENVTNTISGSQKVAEFGITAYDLTNNNVKLDQVTYTWDGEDITINQDDFKLYTIDSTTKAKVYIDSSLYKVTKVDNEAVDEETNKVTISPSATAYSVTIEPADSTNNNVTVTQGSGVITEAVVVTGADWNNAVITFGSQTGYETADENVTVTLNGHTLTKGTHYTVVSSQYADGVAKVVVTPKNDSTVYFASNAKAVTDYVSVGKDIDKYIKTVALKDTTATYTYTGEAIEPEITVTAKSGVTLTEGVDYEIVYEDNVNAGSAKFYVQGLGDYAGTTEVKNFTIAKAKLSDAVVTAEDVAYETTLPTVADLAKALTVKSGDQTLVYGTDFTVTGNTVKEGENTLRINALANTNYTGYTTVTVNVVKATDISTAEIATIANVAYTGEAQTPALTVTLGDKELVEGTDYTVAYTNNTEVGCATATITGIGAYTGTNERNFVIVPQQVTGLKAVKKTATTLKLQFNAVEGADGYKIYDAETGKAIASVSTQNGADVLKKTITGLNAGETRKYKVRAYKIVNGTKRYAEYSAVYTKATAKK
jgi:hypothetical protein